MNFIFNNCSLSTLVFQERIYNKYYLKLSTEDAISDDLLALMYQTFVELGVVHNFNIEGIRKAISEKIKKYANISDLECGDDKNICSGKYSEGYGQKLNGKVTEAIKTIYGQLENRLGVDIEPAPDEWDRLYNLDFFIEVNGKYLGIQIKPTTFKHTFEDYKWKEMQEASHRKFQKKFGGKVFIVFSVTEGKKKIIANPEIIDEIKKEIERLKGPGA
ncbi:MAG: MjaI family restriction endonuclease [candidate division KSB1 bacterium]|nr:MjaI family restriction endonuclease [candidate division KSB1 bacterium]MDZ7305147.1 MjaI family restriction endonuclease [candidate division KSB1 bacterium]MDZ7314231.1 MjaI family restriction endonuclease [candidate division KSB1 bacterium]